MKRKFIALALCMALVMSIAVPSTLAMGITSDSSAYDMTVGTDLPTESTTPDSTLPTEESPESIPAASAEPTTTETPVASAEPTITEMPAASAEPDEGMVLSSEQVNAIYNALMAASTLEEMESILTQLSEAELDALATNLTTEQLNEIDYKTNSFSQPKDFPSNYSAVNFTNAAPFLPPVDGSTNRKDDYFFQSPENPDNGIETTKTVSRSDSNGTYTLSLEAWVTGAKTITEQTKQIPTDIILVLDQSGSMEQPFPTKDYVAVIDTQNSNLYSIHRSLYVKLKNGNFAKVTVDRSFSIQQFHYVYTYSYKDEYGQTVKAESHSEASNGPNWDFYTNHPTRMIALQSAVAQFANSVAKKALGPDKQADTSDDVNHRIAMVGFGCSKTHRYHYENTELFIGDQSYRYDELTDALYQSAFQNMNTTAGVHNIEQSVEQLTADGATYVDLGVAIGNTIFAQNEIPAGEKRNRVMIVFTDGEPGYDGYEHDVAASAIEQANITKTAHLATVYSVGIFDGANANDPGSSNDHAPIKDKCNWFMQNLSSNNGKVQDPSYYLSAADSDALNNIFETISDNIESGGSSIQLESQSVMKDVISDYFQLPQNVNETDIKVYTADYIGENTFSDKTLLPTPTVSISQDRKTISVTNFNYSENWVGTVRQNGKTSYRGKKLIVEIPIAVRDGFLGGNQVPTNGAASGIYENAASKQALEHFQIPTTNVAIPQFLITAQDKNMYLNGKATDLQLLHGSQVQCGAKTLDFSQPNFGLEAWQTKFIDISVPSVVSRNYDGKKDGTYTVSVTVNPRNSGTETPRIYSGTGTITVFHPEIEYKDSTIYYGETANYAAQNTPKNNVAWTHNGTVDSNVTMTGAKPELQYTYNPEEGAFQHDTDVSISVRIGAEDVTPYVTFINNSKTHQSASDHQFTVYVKTCSLTVQKNANAPGVFKFHIHNDANTVDMDVVIEVTANSIHQSQIVTINGLPKGQYTVTEDTNWSWNFTTSDKPQTISLDKNTPHATVTFTNTLRNKWLNDSVCVKNFPGMSTTGKS